MKTKLLVTSILLFVATSIIATNPNVVRTEKHTETETIEELILYPKSNTAPSLKCVNRYDFAGVLQEKTKFQWNKYTKNWVPMSKSNYSQNAKTKQLVISYTAWDSKNDNWSKDSQVLTYDYKNDGMLSMAVDQEKELK